LWCWCSFACRSFASFDYEEGPLRPADLVLLELLVNGTPVDVLARLVPGAAAQRLGRQLVGKLKELLDRQQYEVVLQVRRGWLPCAGVALTASIHLHAWVAHQTPASIREKCCMLTTSTS
jgi:hypothetical protein